MSFCFRGKRLLFCKIAAQLLPRPQSLWAQVVAVNINLPGPGLIIRSQLDVRASGPRLRIRN